MKETELQQISETEYIAVEAQPVEFTVYRDGDIDHEYYKEQARRERVERMKAVGKSMLRGLGYAAENTADAVKGVMKDAGRELYMMAYDAEYGTNFRKQYHERKREERNREFASRIGLTAMR